MLAPIFPSSAVSESIMSYRLPMLQASQRSCRCPIPGGAQGQDGWGPGQPELVGGNQPMAEGWDLVDLNVPSNPTQTIL